MMDTPTNQEHQEPDEPDPRAFDTPETPVTDVDITPEDQGIAKEKARAEYNE